MGGSIAVLVSVAIIGSLSIAVAQYREPFVVRSQPRW